MEVVKVKICEINFSAVLGTLKKRRLQIFLYACIINCMLLIFCYEYAFNSDPVKLLSLVDEDESINETRIILFWVPYYNRDDYYFGFGQGPFLRRSCSVTNCITTNDRSLVSDADAVVFHMRNINVFDLPPIRHQRQRWVFYLYEPPPHTNVDLKQFRNFFNWTMTYRRDSDVPYTFTYVPKSSDEVLPQKSATAPSSVARNKTKVIAWVVSNCWPYSRRDVYVRELSKHVPVDVYGACGIEPSKYCSKSTSRNECLGNLEKDYKFYLSFENALCKDYVTEKWSDTIHYDMVPVVYGGANYSAFAPPHSYIDALDFSSPKHLADYLLSLDRDERLYRRYLEWKKSYTVITDNDPWCTLCAKLNNLSEPTKTYRDMHDFWVKGGNCTTPMELPEMGLSMWQRRLQNLVDMLSIKFTAYRYEFESLMTHLLGFIR